MEEYVKKSAQNAGKEFANAIAQSFGFAGFQHAYTA